MKAYAWSGLALSAAGPADAAQFEIASAPKNEVKPLDIGMPKATASACTYDRWGKWIGWVTAGGYCTAGPDGEGSCTSNDGGTVWGEPTPSDC